MAGNPIEELINPFSIEAEQSILGAILIRFDVMNTVIETVTAECFSVDQHRDLFRIMQRSFMSNEHADVVTILHAALAERLFESEAQGRSYLRSMMELVPSVANVESYCKIVVNQYHIRQLAEVAHSIIDEIQGGETDAQLLLDTAEQKIYDIREGKDTTGFVHIRDVISETYRHIGFLAGPDREKYIGARSGFAHLDSVTSGLNKSDLILIAARPAMGKTAFALNIAETVAYRSGKNVAIFSLEMPRNQLASRLLSSIGEVDSQKLRSGRLKTDDFVKLANAAGFGSSKLNMYIDDSASITVPQMKAKLRRVKNLGLVVIDYLGLIGTTLRTENRVQVISEITRQLKIMAKDMNVPVILLSQLSRGPENRTDKRPMLSDLRESGSIEQDADQVFFLYRDAYYNKDCKTPNIAECIIAKNRHGETGTIQIGWNGQYTRFSDLAPQGVEPS